MLLSTELLAYYRQIAQQPLTVVDVETTGKYPATDRIIELSVLQATLVDGIQHQQTNLINPETQIPEIISDFTGISQEMVADAPIAAQAFPAYLPLLHTGILTAHNIEFDYPFLQAEYQRSGISFLRPAADQFCTVQFARLMLPDLPSRSLPDLVRHFQFNVGRSHRAEADTLACWLLAERLLTEIMNEPDEVILSRFANQWLPLKYAAKLLRCKFKEGQRRLIAAGVSPHRVERRNGKGRWMYRRGDVERVLQQQQEGTQLSCL
ncbi:MAG: hypothetical protein Kow00121_45410 [Elainellaceae cyanobacterium]